jgi:hypothetical protein
MIGDGPIQPRERLVQVAQPGVDVRDPERLAAGAARLLVDREIVAKGLAAVTPSSIAPADGFRTISEVVRRGPDLVPGANLLVAYEPVPEFAAAYTYSDRDGRYLLCGVPRDQKVSIGAYRGFENGEWFAVPAGGSTDKADLDMTFFSPPEASRSG